MHVMNLRLRKVTPFAQVIKGALDLQTAPEVNPTASD
jgi:hypothetical protein